MKSVTGFAIRLALSIASMACAALAQTAPRTPEGHWEGTIQGTVRVIVHVERSGSGLKGTLDSPDQGAMGLPIDTLLFAGDTLRFTMSSIRGEYAGAMNQDGTKIEGRWRQGGYTLPLALARRDQIVAPRRPQEPARPYPYAEDTVRVLNHGAGLSLAGTLTTPTGKGPFPCAILITGSGPEDRDETVFGHKPFLVLADHLTRHGVAVLRMDDRGVGGSSGRFSLATSEDFASDIAAAVDFVKTRRGIDPRHIGLIGHSEGGLVGPMVAVKSKSVAFVVMLAGPGVPGDSVLVLQVERMARAEGSDAASAAADRRLQAGIISAVGAGPDSAAVTANVRRLIRARIASLSEEERKNVAHPDSIADQELRGLNTPWMRFFIRYDPRPTLRQLRCPVLALNGSKDVQVAPQENLTAIEAALHDGKNPDYKVKELIGLNHLFQRAPTGALSEYVKIEETMAPAALDEVTQWIVAHSTSGR